MSGFVADSAGHTTASPQLSWDEYEWLIARIAALEAQAALDGPVAGAARSLGSENIYRLAQLSVSSEQQIIDLADATYTAEGKGIKGAALARDVALTTREKGAE